MAEARGSRKSKTQKDLTVYDVAAAHQLMQLSDEGSNNNKKRERSTDEEEVDQVRSLSDMTSATIQEIFGKDEVFRPKKQRKYRSLVSIYMTTRPIKAENGRTVKLRKP